MNCPIAPFEIDFVKMPDDKFLLKPPKHRRTINHPMLSRLDNEQLRQELIEPKTTLEEKLGHEIRHLAYPFGAQHEVGAREFRVAREAGFISAVTTRSGHIYEQHENYLHILPRISVNYGDSVEDLRWKLSGIYSMVRYRGRKLIVN